MPELPDVAGFKRYLDATSLHKPIASTEVGDERFIKGVSKQTLVRKLKGSELTRSRRWGKHLFAELTGGGFLVLHFGMTGFLQYEKDQGDLPHYSRLVLHFANDYRLDVVCQRLLGRAGFTKDIDKYAQEHDLGPDALEGMNLEGVVERLSTKSGSVKSALMDQSLMAGIGNVYSDEILFQARIHPKAQVQTLGDDRRQELARSIRHVLSVAAEQNPGQLPKDWLLHHRRKNKPCPQCDGRIDTTKVNSRTAYFCPHCQEE